MKRMTSIIFCDLTPVRVIGVVLSLIMSIGFFWFDSDNQNYAQLYEMVNSKAWSLIFLFHAVASSCVLFNSAAAEKVGQAVDLVGIWIWSFVFWSFLFHDKSPVQSTEILLVVPALLQIWLLTERKHS